jgi:hypothetical protein
MTNSFFYYLIESSVCLLLFVLVYRFLIANLTHFSWMRVYLLLSVVLSLILPVIIIPIQWNSSLLTSDLFSNSILLQSNQIGIDLTKKSLINGIQTNGDLDIQQLIFYGLLIIYFAGLVYKANIFAWNLKSIHKCVKQNFKSREGNYWLVNLENEMPPFSFLNYIFVTTNYKNLPANDIQQIKNHELVHVKQYHSLDILFIELTSIVFWLNPVMNYIKKSIREIHEYIVDEKIAGNGKNRKNYAQLLLNLTSEAKYFNLSTSFTGQQIKRRILMITKSKSLPKHKLIFTILIPLTIFLLLSFSYIKNPNSKVYADNDNSTKLFNQQSIAKISWSGNTVYSAKALNKALGLKAGDNYVQDDVLSRLLDKVGLLYLDNGYIFNRLNFTTQIRNGKVDLNFFVTEGDKAIIGEIIINGNSTVPINDILKKITFKSSDFFSKKKIITSVKSLSAMGKFKSVKFTPQLIPHMKEPNQDFAVLDILFEVTERDK